jgi:plasmid stabilization system protein ParE
MGYFIDFAPEALDDLEGIVREIAKDNPERAESFGYELVGKTDVLEDFPRSGKVVPEFGEDHIRELQRKPYRIVYQIIDEKTLIVILRYWHAARGSIQK